MLYKPGPYKNSFVRRIDGPESRDLRAVCDNLEKELDRKDSRNDNLSRELFSLRASYANQQVKVYFDVHPTIHSFDPKCSSILNVLYLLEGTTDCNRYFREVEY